MERSDELRDLTLRIYEATATGDLSFVERHVSRQEGAVFVGTDPNEWWEGFEALCEQGGRLVSPASSLRQRLYFATIGSQCLHAIKDAPP